jgi:hypothetical protein
LKSAPAKGVNSNIDMPAASTDGDNANWFIEFLRKYCNCFGRR